MSDCQEMRKQIERAEQRVAEAQLEATRLRKMLQDRCSHPFEWSSRVYRGGHEPLELRVVRVVCTLCNKEFDPK